MVSAATFRLPGPLAIAVAQVDAMSGGRITLALGAGWAEQEHHAYGIPFPSPRERFERLEEQLDLITGMWRTPVGETFSFDGTHYQLVDCPALPKPVQDPHPPVIVGGTGPRRTPNLAARFADEFNLPPFNAPAAAAEAFARVRAACEEVGRDPATLELSVTLTTVCGADRAEVERRGAVSPAQFQAADLAGTPDEVLEQLAAYREVGADRAYLRLARPPRRRADRAPGCRRAPGSGTLTAPIPHQSERSWNPVRRASNAADRSSGVTRAVSDGRCSSRPASGHDTRRELRHLDRSDLAALHHTGAVAGGVHPVRDPGIGRAHDHPQHTVGVDTVPFHDGLRPVEAGLRVGPVERHQHPVGERPREVVGALGQSRFHEQSLAVGELEHALVVVLERHRAALRRSRRSSSS